jgi:hypothetical protein
MLSSLDGQVGKGEREREREKERERERDRTKEKERERERERYRKREKLQLLRMTGFNWDLVCFVPGEKVKQWLKNLRCLYFV